MQTSSLKFLFRPGSVAIVGASSDPNKTGGRPLAFLKRAGWGGRILPVNPSGADVQGIPSFKSLSAIGEPIDQVIVAVPAARVLSIAAECVERGVQALQVFSSGFEECEALLELKNRSCGMRILGPNSLGLFNAVDGFFGTFATALDGAWPRTGQVGVATQSGAFGSYFFGMAQQRGLGFSHFVATGNELDVDVADCVAYLAADPATRLIVMTIEGSKDGRKLAAALAAARSAGKPVLAMKVGASRAGARAVATHTGALSGEDRIFEAVLRDAGVFRADSLQAPVEAAYAASIGPLPAGRKLLVVSTSGGIGVLSADAAEAGPAGARLDMPEISGAAVADIERIAPMAAGHNPVDTSAGILGDLSAYASIAECAVRDQPFDAVLCFMAHIARNPAHWGQLRDPLYALRSRYPAKHFSAVLLADAAITQDLEHHGFSVFADPNLAVASLAALAPRPAIGVAQASLAPDMGRLQGSLATEADAKRALREQGIVFAPGRFVQHAQEALDAARELGWPIVLKIVSPDIAHKTEAGGVQLDIGDEAALRAALPAMLERVRQRALTARIDGFLVARQLRGGVELLLGSQVDPIFGPVVTVGAGGVLTELLADACVRLAPVDTDAALQMLSLTRVGRLLDGWRGATPLDKLAVARQIAVLSQVAWTNRDHVASIDLNPVLVLPDGAYALDALIVQRQSLQEKPDDQEHPT